MEIITKPRTIHPKNYLSIDTLGLTIIKIHKTMTSEMIELFLSKPFPVLKRLICTNTNIISIPSLPSLTQIFCDMCPDLINISMMPMLDYLNCYGCTSLTNIPPLPCLKTLICSMCTSITSITMLPNLERIFCEECQNLVDISILPCLTELVCCSCTSLTNISDLQNLTYLSCRGCTMLKDIPILPCLDFIQYSSDIVNEYTIPLKCQHQVDTNILTKVLLYNPYNINSIFVKDCVSSETIDSNLSILSEYLEYADNATRIRLEQLCYDKGIILPTLVKPGKR